MSVQEQILQMSYFRCNLYILSLSEQVCYELTWHSCVIIVDDDDAAVPRKFISYDHTCSDKLKLFKLHLKYDI